MAAVLITAVACEEPKEIGLTPSTLLNVLFTDTLTITRTTSQLDSVRSNDQATLLVGQYTDPLFGQVQAKAYVNATLPNDIIVTDTLTKAVTPANRIVHDSTRLVLGLSRSWYGDTTNQQELQVFQLTDSLRSSGNYDITSTVAASSTPLARQRIRPRPTALDSAPARFVLPDSYGRQLLALANTEAGKLANPQAFRAQFNPGLLISSSTTGATPTAVLGYQPGFLGQDAFGRPTIVGSYIVVNYHVEGERTRRQQFLFLNGKRFNQIIASRGSTPITSLRPGQSLPATTTGRTYVQPATGVTTKLQFPSLTNLLQSGRIAINRADLVITPTPAEDGKRPLPQFLALTEVNDQNRLVRSDISTGAVRLFTVQSQAGTVNISGLVAPGGPVSRLPGSYVYPQVKPLDSRTQTYTFDIAGYLQSVASGVSPNNGLAILTPSNALFGQSQQSGLIDQTQAVLTDRVWRLVLDGKASVKLTVFYTRSN